MEWFVGIQPYRTVPSHTPYHVEPLKSAADILGRYLTAKAPNTQRYTMSHTLKPGGLAVRRSSGHHDS